MTPLAPVSPTGAPGSRSYAYAEAVIDWCVDVHRRLGDGGGLLVSLWVFEYASQNGTYSVIPGRDDAFLQRIQAANAALQLLVSRERWMGEARDKHLRT